MQRLWLIMKVYFEPYGCTLNYGESRIMEKLVENAGNIVVNGPGQADVLVLVTCTVIETTENKMLKRLEEFSKFKKPVIVAGCMASVQEKTVLDVMPSAKILPPDKIFEIPNLLGTLNEKIEVKREGTRSSTSEKITSIDAIVPISNGCLGSCTYCITRLARGELRSYSPDSIIDSISNALSHDLHEIRLTAQDTAVYGLDQNTTLPALLKTINEKFTDRDDLRFRVGMMNPNTTIPILDELIEQYRSDLIFKFLHLPVQSGDNDILMDMKRGYEVQDFIEIIAKFRDAFPDLTLSTDMIIGYPGETEEQFQKSVELIKKIKPNIVNITRFSGRPGTEAYDRKDAVHGRIQKERSRLLTKVRFRVSKMINEEVIGKDFKILITEIGKRNSVMGRTDSYLPVVVREDIKLGSFENVKIVEAADSYLVGKVIENNIK
jgi:MiaB-like tRNA modifying enzyme